jgi:hypothetical protein
MIAVAAMASVGETIAPSTRAGPQPRSGIRACATAATATVVKITSPIDSRPIARRFAFRSRTDVYQPAAVISGGRKIRKMMSGSSCRGGRPGTNPRTRPPRTRRIG